MSWGMPDVTANQLFSDPFLQLPTIPLGSLAQPFVASHGSRMVSLLSQSKHPGQGLMPLPTPDQYFTQQVRNKALAPGPMAVNIPAHLQMLQSTGNHALLQHHSGGMLQPWERPGKKPRLVDEEFMPSSRLGHSFDSRMQGCRLGDLSPRRLSSSSLAALDGAFDYSHHDPDQHQFQKTMEMLGRWAGAGDEDLHAPSGMSKDPSITSNSNSNRDGSRQEQQQQHLSENAPMHLMSPEPESAQDAMLQMQSPTSPLHKPAAEPASLSQPMDPNLSSSQPRPGSLEAHLASILNPPLEESIPIPQIPSELYHLQNTLQPDPGRMPHLAPSPHLVVNMGPQLATQLAWRAPVAGPPAGGGLAPMHSRFCPPANAALLGPASPHLAHGTIDPAMLPMLCGMPGATAGMVGMSPISDDILQRYRMLQLLQAQGMGSQSLLHGESAIMATAMGTEWPSSDRSGGQSCSSTSRGSHSLKGRSSSHCGHVPSTSGAAPISKKAGRSKTGTSSRRRWQRGSDGSIVDKSAVSLNRAAKQAGETVALQQQQLALQQQQLLQQQASEQHQQQTEQPSATQLQSALLQQQYGLQSGSPAHIQQMVHKQVCQAASPQQSQQTLQQDGLQSSSSRPYQEILQEQGQQTSLPQRAEPAMHGLQLQHQSSPQQLVAQSSQQQTVPAGLNTAVPSHGGLMHDTVPQGDKALFDSLLNQAAGLLSFSNPNAASAPVATPIHCSILATSPKQQDTPSSELKLPSASHALVAATTNMPASGVPVDGQHESDGNKHAALTGSIGHISSLNHGGPFHSAPLPPSAPAAEGSPAAAAADAGADSLLTGTSTAMPPTSAGAAGISRSALASVEQHNAGRGSLEGSVESAEGISEMQAQQLTAEQPAAMHFSNKAEVSMRLELDLATEELIEVHGGMDVCDVREVVDGLGPPRCSLESHVGVGVEAESALAPAESKPGLHSRDTATALTDMVARARDKVVPLNGTVQAAGGTGLPCSSMELGACALVQMQTGMDGSLHEKDNIVLRSLDERDGFAFRILNDNDIGVSIGLPTSVSMQQLNMLDGNLGMHIFPMSQSEATLFDHEHPSQQQLHKEMSHTAPQQQGAQHALPQQDLGLGTSPQEVPHALLQQQQAQHSSPALPQQPNAPMSCALLLDVLPNTPPHPCPVSTAAVPQFSAPCLDSPRLSNGDNRLGSCWDMQLLLGATGHIEFLHNRVLHPFTTSGMPDTFPSATHNTTDRGKQGIDMDGMLSSLKSPKKGVKRPGELHEETQMLSENMGPAASGCMLGSTSIHSAALQASLPELVPSARVVEVGTTGVQNQGTLKSQNSPEHSVGNDGVARNAQDFGSVAAAELPRLASWEQMLNILGSTTTPPISANTGVITARAPVNSTSGADASLIATPYGLNWTSSISPVANIASSHVPLSSLPVSILPLPHTLQCSTSLQAPMSPFLQSLLMPPPASKSTNGMHNAEGLPIHKAPRLLSSLAPSAFPSALLLPASSYPRSTSNAVLNPSISTWGSQSRPPQSNLIGPSLPFLSTQLIDGHQPNHNCFTPRASIPTPSSLPSLQDLPSSLPAFLRSSSRLTAPHTCVADDQMNASCSLSGIVSAPVDQQHLLHLEAPRLNSVPSMGEAADCPRVDASTAGKGAAGGGGCLPHKKRFSSIPRSCRDMPSSLGLVQMVCKQQEGWQLAGSEMATPAQAAMPQSDSQGFKFPEGLESRTMDQQVSVLSRVVRGLEEELALTQGRVRSVLMQASCVSLELEAQRQEIQALRATYEAEHTSRNQATLSSLNGAMTLMSSLAQLFAAHHNQTEQD